MLNYQSINQSINQSFVRSFVRLVIPPFLFLSCLGIDNGNKAQESLLLPKLNTDLVAYSNNPNGYSGENPEYRVSDKEVKSISELETTLNHMKWLDEKLIAESVQNFDENFYYQKRTESEIEADVLDWDLGLPPENRKLEGSAKENKKSENIANLKVFFETVQRQISNLPNDDLRVIRINSLIGIYSHNILKPYLEKNPEIDRSIFELAIQNHVKTRELVIDEMIKRGIDL
ncbi:MAG: hypothetical protein IPL26_15135 [Leptospiraceae bacterium]|nr:hypothetical protein [Leptospiraceae bacterium]